MSEEEKKPVIHTPTKSSMEILSELFQTFDAKPPVIIKKEKLEGSSKKHKKKKHKHKEKKHKKKIKKEKKRKRNDISNSSSSSSDESMIDLAKILIKQEKDVNKSNIKIEGTDLSLNLPSIKNEKDKNEMDLLEVSSKLEEKTRKVYDKNKDSKILIKDLKLSSVFASATEESHKTANEEGELSSEGSLSEKKNGKSKKHKKKHKHDHNKSEKRKHRSVSNENPEKKIKVNDKKSSGSLNKDDFYKGYSKTKDNKHKDYRSTSVDRERHSRYDRHRNDYSREREDNKHVRENSFYKKEETHRFRARDAERERNYERDSGDKWFLRDRYRGYGEKDRDRRLRTRSVSRERSSCIDKKKLLEIARKNAIQMMKSGSLPGSITLGPRAQEKVIAAIKAGGKTVEELTDFCKTLSKKEELDELLSSGGERNDSDSDADKPFHHPFQLKDRPTSITMNIKNSVPLPIKTTQERSTELRLQFPVSSGQQHRTTEGEWVPVERKTKASSTSHKTTPILAIEAAPPKVPNTPAEVTQPVSTIPLPGPQVFPPTTAQGKADISSIVSERLTAMRKLQENPLDVQALSQMYKSTKEVQCWAESKQQIGQFTGSVGANFLSQQELSSGSQAWAKKNQLQLAAPVSGGMGMHLLQKMGWKPGEGLGKEKTGALEPLLLEVKLDKKGLVANEETRKKKPNKVNNNQAVQNLQGKHPVSLLGEYASKNKLGAPQYDLCFECGPDHKKNFVFKVTINGMEYKPNIASPNKKDAKANAATLCLQKLGLM